MKKISLAIAGFCLAFCLFVICAPDASAQFGGGYTAAASGMNTLSGGAVPSAVEPIAASTVPT